MSIVTKSVNNGMMSAGIKTVSSVVDVCNGKKTVSEAAGDIAVAGAKGVGKGAATAVATGVATSVIAGPAVVAVAPAVIGSAIVYGVGKLFSKWF